jgi:replicative DNA helicase
MFISREEYYLGRAEPSMDDTAKYAKWQDDMNRAMNVAEVIIAKHRNGAIGNVRLRFDGNLTLFDNLAEGY